MVINQRENEGYIATFIKTTHLAFTCSKSTMEALEQCMKSVQI